MESIILQLSLTTIGELIKVWLFIAAIALGIFLAIRWFWLWYWKINRLVENQERQLNVLKAILECQRKMLPPEDHSKDRLMTEEELEETVRQYNLDQLKKRPGY